MRTPEPELPVAERAAKAARWIDGACYAGVAALAIYTWTKWGARYFDPYLQSDDTRIVIYPFWSCHTPYFRGDFLAESMLTLAPPFYRGLVYVLTAIVDVLMLPKVIQLAAIAWTAAHAFRMGRRRAGGAGALLGVYLVLHSFHILDRTGGGLPRAFSYPLLLMLVDALESGRRRAAGLAVVLGFALYPPAGLIGAVVFGWTVLARTYRAWREKKPEGGSVPQQWMELGVTALLSLAVLLPSMNPGPEFGAIHTLEQARGIPAFGPGGRTELVPLKTLPQAMERERFQMARVSSDALVGRRLSLPVKGDVTAFDLILLLALAGVLLRRPAEATLPLLILAVGMAGFVLANLLAFRLYDPARMLSLSLPMAALPMILRGFAGWGRSKPASLANRGITLGALGGFLLVQGIALDGYPHLNIDARPDKELFELVQTLPADVRLAGHPKRMDNLPLWGKRPILISEETSQPWFTKIWDETTRRLDANIEAYYAVSVRPIRRLRKDWGVTHMLVHEDDLRPDTPMHGDMFVPYGERMRRLAEERWDRLVWRALPEEAVVGRAAGFILFDLERVERLLAGGGPAEVPAR